MSSDKLQTYLGLSKGVIVAAIDYVLHLGPDGLNWKSPVFLSGMAYAIIEGIKGYYAAGVKA